MSVGAEVRGVWSAAGSARALDFRLLGPLEMLRDGQSVDLGGPRQRALLTILLVSAGRVVPADALADRLWAGVAPPRAAGTLQAYVSNLRRVLEPDRAPRQPARVLASVRPGYTLNVDPEDVDAGRFLRLAGQGQRALADGDAATAAATLRSALKLWRGPALVDFADAPFAAVEITRLEEARLQALEDRIEAELTLSGHGALVPELMVLVEENPLRERLRGQLMLALYRAGRQGDALDAARAGRAYLAEELGLDPDPALQELEARILAQDPALNRPGPKDRPAPVTVDLVAVEAGEEPADRIVGRASELGVLERALAAATSGDGRVVLIGGEPGIGKTRLVEAFTAGLAPAQVGWGRSHDGAGTPPFWPWRQALLELTADVDDGLLATALAADAGIVAEVLPELATRLALDTPAPPIDPTAARYRFFDAASRLLVAVGSLRPVVVVLDDIQWADAASLELLRFLGGELQRGRVVVAATYRDVGWQSDEMLSATLADLARRPHVERLLLSGLSPDGVADLLTGLLGGRVSPSLVAATVSRTDGNPLFVVHLARLLTTARPAMPELVVQEQIPPEVADLIGWRVAALPDRTRRVLATGSAIGREFDLGLLVQVFGEPPDEVLARLEPAVRAGLVVEDDRPGHYRFTHALIRDAIHAETGRARAAHLHGQVGDALVAAWADDRDLAAIAEHYWQAAGVGWAEQAVTYALMAAERAAVALAHEDEGRHLARALEVVTGSLQVPDRDTRELEVQLRRARLRMRVDGYGVPEVGIATRRARDG